MTPLDASLSGTFAIGGDMPVARLGFGAMRITGEGIWGPPPNREGALATLRKLPEFGVDFIDTANSYGPYVSEELIREALYPYGRVRIATKAGLTRLGPGRWDTKGDPDYLLRQAHASRDRLGVERIDLWQLHRIDPAVPRSEQFAAIRTLIDTGVIKHGGLSEVTIDEIEAAQRYFPVATVQNRYNLADRTSEAVLDYCEANAIGFVPWYPLGSGKLAEPGTILDRVAAAHGASPGQIAIAWLLKKSPVILPIPGTGKVSHLEENVRAASIRLTDEEFEALDVAGRG
ncbi:UNVERIFIED_ORG: aryl-alcohol dehydrogenase-like predicted oxidoreductase [Xanthobacter viscosus]|uniref:Aldo/keto reductase n=1 Tax=Xanthobacter autotrophicus TaxID=280 RepID=A0A6C1KM06_XANAU|nr:aldo/keto reductase [Xanthobacter autotrophicus]TLX44154.1 aldo/keto reductase [Xanthobacter autotrophicus]